MSAVNDAFVNFQPNSLRSAGALGYTRFTPFFIDPRNSVSKARFIHANRVYLGDKPTPSSAAAGADGFRSAVFRDEDGSVTGAVGSWVAVRNPLLLDDHSILRRSWNAAVSVSPYGRLFIDNRDTHPHNLAPVTVARSQESAGEYPLWGSPGDATTVDFETTVIADQSYRIRLGGPFPERLRLSLEFRAPGDWVQLAVPYDHSFVYVYRDGDFNTPLSAAPDWKTFEAGAGNCYVLQSGILHVRIVIPRGAASTESFLDISRSAHPR